MNDILSAEEKLDYIHQWENQAGRVLRFSITILGLVISASSVFITLIVTSENVTIPENLIENGFNNLVTQLNALPVLGELTAAVLAFILTMSTAIFASIALISIFVLAPFQSLEVMDVAILTEDSDDDGLETLFSEKKEGWHSTVVFFRIGLFSLIFAVLFSLPIFVVRNTHLATAVLFILTAIALMVIHHYYRRIIYYLWNSTRLDLLNLVGGVMFIALFMARPTNPDSIWDITPLVILCLPYVGGLIRGISFQDEQVARLIGRDTIFVGVFGLGSVPTLLVLTDLVNVNLADLVFLVMATIGFVSGASIIGLGVGYLTRTFFDILARQKSKLPPIREKYAAFRER